MAGRRIGVDLGGTKVCGVVVESDGQIVLGPVERPTERQRSPGEILETLVGVVRELQDQAGEGRLGIGIGIPTTLDEDEGLVYCPNLPTMAGVRIRAELEGRLGEGVVLDNDANCFAYGEWRAGAGRGTATCCGITLGTGFGMGLIVEGKLYRGRHGSAGEICYSPYRDGRQIEEVVSGMGIGRHYQERTGMALEAGEVAQKAREGDREAVEIWREFGEALGFGLSYAVNLLDPEVVVIGGSMAAAWELFFPAVQATLARYAYDPEVVNLVPASLGRVAGAVGAGLLPEG